MYLQIQIKNFMYSESKQILSIRLKQILLSILVFVVASLTIILKYFHFSAIGGIILPCSFALLALLVITLLYWREMGKQIYILAGISFIACLIKIFDGAFLSAFQRFCCDTLLYFFIGVYMIDRKRNRVSFSAMFFILPDCTDVVK